MAELTIRDIARQAGVSVATVSRVINGNGNVKPELKKRVSDVIAKTEFMPNISARTLKSKKTQTIGVVISDISDRYYSLMTKTLADTLAEKDYSLIICCTDNNAAKEKMFFDFLCAKSVDGIILNTVGTLDKEICALSKRVPLVMVNRKIALCPNARLDYIGSDDFNGGYEMTKYLLQKSHRRIGILNGNLNVSSGMDRYRGFCAAMKDAGITVDESYPYRFNGNFDFTSGYTGIAELMKHNPKPTAVITTNDSTTVGAMQYCQEHKIRIPEDLSLVAYGDVDNAILFAVHPTYITLNPHTIGLRAAQCLFDRIGDPLCPNREIVFTSNLKEGDSVRAPNE